MKQDQVCASYCHGLASFDPAPCLSFLFSSISLQNRSDSASSVCDLRVGVQGAHFGESNIDFAWFLAILDGLSESLQMLPQLSILGISNPKSGSTTTTLLRVDKVLANDMFRMLLDDL